MAKRTKAARKGAELPEGAEAGTGAAKFPRHSVEKALRIPRAIVEQNAGHACTVDEAAGFCKVGISGPFRVEVSSATKYGLLKRLEDGRIEPTDRAKAIIRPKAEGDDKVAYREAVLAAPQVGPVYQHYRGENLPDDTFFKNTVVDTYKVPTDKFDDFKSIFLESLEKASLIEKHGEKLRIVDVTDDARVSEQKTNLTKKLGKEVKVASSDVCFVMQPFAAPLGDYYEKIYKPAIEKAGLSPLRADADIFGTGKIMEQVWRGIRTARVLVAELTSRNPNVFYELGLAHALDKPVVLVSATEQDVPFDLTHIRVIYYDKHDPFWGQKLLDKVTENILSALKNPEEAIFRGDK
jgi:hypothetical protein